MKRRGLAFNEAALAQLWSAGPGIEAATFRHGRSSTLNIEYLFILSEACG
jgi:hypothetical protein